jgi:hypothetical protein
MPQPARALVGRWRGAVRARAVRPSDRFRTGKRVSASGGERNEVPASVVPPSACAAGGLGLVLELRWDFAAVFSEFDHDLFVQPDVHRAGSFVLPESEARLQVVLERRGRCRASEAGCHETRMGHSRGRCGQDGCVATVRTLASIWHFLSFSAGACLRARCARAGSGQACGGAARLGGRGQWVLRGGATMA